MQTYYVNQFKQPFSIIVISETWIRTEKEADFELDGGGFNYINRERRTNYVDKKYRVVGNKV